MISRMLTFDSLAAVTGSIALTPPMIWLLAAVGLAAFVGLMLRARGWGASAGWIALAFAGQACSLQLIEAGPNIRLHLFYGWQDFLKTWHGIFLILLAVQGVIVFWGAWNTFLRKDAVRKVLGKLIAWPEALALLVIAIYGCVTIAPGVAQAFVHGGFLGQAVLHASKVVLGLALLGVGTLNLALAAATLPGNVIENLRARWENSERRWLPWAAALWVVAVSSFIAVFVYDGMPHIADEMGHIFQAKYLSIGRLYLPPPVDAKALVVPFQLVEGSKWFSSPQIGGAVFLALGYRLGVPWLINPLLGGVTVLLAHIFLRRVYNRKLADAAALLIAASPWVLFLSASVMPHATALALALLGMVGVERARNVRSILWAGVAGLSIGGVLHVRPLEAVIVAAVMGVWWLSAGWKKLSVAALAATVLTGCFMTALLLGYNKMMVGNPLVMPINRFCDLEKYPGANRLGFGPDVGNFGWVGLDALPGHGPIDVVMNTNQNLQLLNFETFGWACGSLIFVILLGVWRKFRGDGVMWGLVLATWAALSFYWFSGGPDFGARYWYLMLVPVAALTVRGAEEFAARLRAAGATTATGARTGAFLLLATVLGTLNLLPWRSLDKYHNYRGIVPDVRSLARQYNFGRSLVFIRGREWPDYDSALPFNPPRFDPDVPGTIYARDLGPESVARLRAYYSDRPVWVVAGPTETKAGFQVIEGPLPPLKTEK
jgi:hypothetical protein